MRKDYRLFAGAAGVLLILLCVSVYTQIQVKRDNGFLEGRSWKDGNVLAMTFLRSRAGQDLGYLEAVADVWKKQQEALKNEGIIVSYRVLQGNAAALDDFNIILITEYKNFRIMEANADKQTVILQQIAKENMQSAAVLNDENVREFFATRVVRDIIMK